MGDSTIMSNAPVYYALIQIKFAPVKAMNKYVEDIQDALRLQGYPLYQENTGKQIFFNVGNPKESMEPTIKDVEQWIMTNPEGNQGFILGYDSITFQTTAYKTHKEFIDGLMLGLEQVMTYAKPALITRIGMRYLDAVLPEGEETIEQYLCDGLHGVKLGLTPIQSTNEQVFHTEVGPLIPQGVIVTRIYKMHGQLSFPPDMIPAGVLVNERFKETPNQWHCIIDTDHFVEGVIQPSLDSVREQLLSLRNVVRESFDNMITPFAKHKWA